MVLQISYFLSLTNASVSRLWTREDIEISEIQSRTVEIHMYRPFIENLDAFHVFLKHWRFPLLIHKTRMFLKKRKPKKEFKIFTSTFAILKVNVELVLFVIVACTLLS